MYNLISLFGIVLLLGIPPGDAMEAARIIGERSVLTEIPAYQDLATALAQGRLQYPARTAVIVSYALCGFAHIASLAIFVGGISALVPKRAGDGRLSRSDRGDAGLPGHRLHSRYICNRRCDGVAG